MQNKIELASKGMPAGAAGNKEAPLFPQAHLPLSEGQNHLGSQLCHTRVQEPKSPAEQGGGSHGTRGTAEPQQAAGSQLQPTKFLCRENENLSVPEINHFAGQDLQTATGLLLHRYRTAGTYDFAVS